MRQKMKSINNKIRASLIRSPDFDLPNEILSWMLATLALVGPLIVVPQLYDSFTLPKVLFIRALVGLIMAVWLLKSLKSGFSWRRSHLGLPMAAFMTAATVATLFSINQKLSVFGQYKRYEDIVTLVGYGLVFFAAIQILDTEKRRRRLILALIISATAVAGYGIAQYFGFEIWRQSGDPDRASSTIGNAVFLGSFLVLILPLAVSRLLAGLNDGESLKKIILFLFTSLIIFGGIIVTFSRAAWLGAAVSSLLFLKLKEVNWRRVLPVIIAVFLIFVIVSIMESERRSYTVTNRLASSLNLQEGTVRTRIIFWKTTLYLITKRPLLGYGPDTMGQVYPQYLPLEARAIERAAKIDKAHNDVLQTAATVGLLGAAVYLIIILTFFYGAVIKKNEKQNSLTFLGLTTGALAYFLAVQFSFSQVEVATIFWLVVGTAVSYQAGDRRHILLPKFGLIALSTALIIAVPLILNKTVIKPAVADWHFQSALRAEESGDLSKALKKFDRATKINPNREVYLSRQGRAQQAAAVSGSKIDLSMAKKSLGSYEAAEKLNPYSAVLYTDIGSLYTVLGRIIPEANDLAIKAYNRSIALDPFASETYLNAAVAYAQKGEKFEAIEQLKLAVAYDSSNDKAYYNLALVYESQGLIKEARKYAEKAAKLNSRRRGIKTLLERLRNQNRRLEPPGDS